MGAILDTAQNNYLTTYAPKSLTRYDTHKKSELRNVYNSIVKLNKESPWYLPTTNKETQNYAVNLKEQARQLNNTIASFGGLEEDGLFRKKSAYSSDTSVATATYIGAGAKEDASLSFSLEVQCLASAQENLGSFLPNDVVRLQPGTYSFDVSINDMNYEFQFTIDSKETNREIQERLSKLINSSGIGLKASLIEAEGKTALRMTSEATGLSPDKEQIFNISDTNTSKASGTVNYFGLDYISKEAANAQFFIDGEIHLASSNHFTVGKAFELQLRGKSLSEEPVTIGLKTDIESLSDNIQGLVDGYNTFLKSTSAYIESQAKSKQLINEFRSIANRYRSSMETVGLNMDQQGVLSLNKQVLHQMASQSNDLSNTFQSLRSFSIALSKKGNQVSLNPMEYVDKTVVAYKNPGHNFASPYTMSAYSGMMFNGYC